MPKIPVDLFFRVTRMVDEDSGYNKNLGVNYICLFDYLFISP